MRKKCKWQALLAALVLLCCALIAACGGKEEYRLSRNSASLTVGKTVQLTVEPEGGAVEWSTSDEAVATVKDGLVTAVAAGEADITAKIDETELVCKVTVSASGLENIFVTFNAGGPTIRFYPSTTLEELRGYLTISGKNTDGSTVTIAAEDVELSFAAGKTSLEPGENTITVAYKGKTATFTVTAEEEAETCTITFRQEGQEDVIRIVGKGEALTDIPAPVGVPGYTVVWDKEDFSSVEESIVVTAVKTANTYTVTYDLGVNKYATLENSRAEVTFGENYTPEVPAYKGSAKFLGWYLADKSGKMTEEKFEGGIYSHPEDITVIAKWQEWSEVIG